MDYNRVNKLFQGGSTPRAALSLEENVTPKSFSPGRLLATPGVLASVNSGRILQCFQMHLRCHWGDALSHDDWKLNDAATYDGSRLLSAYWINPHDHSAGKFWIITEAQSETEQEDSQGSRAATTILLPEEY
jgi:hypothetical protein